MKEASPWFDLLPLFLFCCFPEIDATFSVSSQVYESGQAQRALSMILRSSAAFSFTLFAQTDDGEFAFFQSGMLRVPTQAQIEASNEVVIACTSGLNGHVIMRWDPGSMGGQLLRCVRYKTDVSNARRIRLQTLNGFSL